MSRCRPGSREIHYNTVMNRQSNDTYQGNSICKSCGHLGHTTELSFRRSYRLRTPASTQNQLPFQGRQWCTAVGISDPQCSPSSNIRNIKYLVNANGATCLNPFRELRIGVFLKVAFVGASSFLRRLYDRVWGCNSKVILAFTSTVGIKGLQAPERSPARTEYFGFQTLFLGDTL